MRLLSLPRTIARLMVYPVPAQRPVRPFRTLLRSPRLFGLVSTCLQLRDVWRQERIRKHYTLDDAHHKMAQDYNAEVTQKHVVHVTRRPEEIYQILDLPPRDVRDERLLIVGPRNIAEFVFAWVYGFSWRNLVGVDLYSTNPKILVMNMEEMTFEDGSFDAVAMSATLAYAQDTPKTIAEVFRVLRPGGRFVFTGTHVPDSDQWPGNRYSGNALKDVLHTAGFQIYFHHANSKINSLGQPQTAHRFGVYKPDPDNVSLDPVDL